MNDTAFGEIRGFVSEVRARPQATKWGDIRVFGDWFGGRRGERIVHLVDADVEDNAIVFRFEGGETVRIWGAQETSSKNNATRIGRGNRVRLEWPHGTERGTTKWESVDYLTQEDGSIFVNPTVDWGELAFQPDPTAAAFELLTADYLDRLSS